MKIDSATAANTVTILGASPTWAMVILVAIVGVLALAYFAMKTGFATKALELYAGLKENNVASKRTVEIVEQIRNDQIKSNDERHEHGDRLSRVEKAVQELQAAYCGARDCPHREVKDGD